jgi:hypothetical protein
MIFTILAVVGIVLNIILMVVGGAAAAAGN